MEEIINLNNNGITSTDSEKGLLEVAENMLTEARNTLDSRKSLSVPISELGTLGSGVASLIPALNTVTQTTTMATDGLYKVINAGVGDALKVAKNGNYYGAIKTADGASRLAQLQAAGSVSVTTEAVAALNPATMMMAVALFSIEQDLGKIEEMQRQILSFLEIEKETKIEGDLETLMGIVRKYKTNWDNDRFVASNHKLVLDIQRTARQNMLAYQRKVNDIIGKKLLIVAQSNVKQAYSDLEKKFKYYRLSLYTFSFASFLEILLSGNFEECYIAEIRDEIQKMTETYRELFDLSSLYLEKMSDSALETNVLKGVGTAGKAIGKFIGSIPGIKEGPVDEFLQDGGTHLEQNAVNIEKEAVYHFAAISNPGTHVFIDRMDGLIQIYNHTEQIYFDNRKIYLVADKTA